MTPNEWGQLRDALQEWAENAYPHRGVYFNQLVLRTEQALLKDQPDQPHVWQEYNAHGNTCHYPDCALTEAEHLQEVREQTEAPGWVERTMADVRSGDTIRMVGREETRREVAGALHVPWHVADPSAAGSAEQARDIQYNPHRYQQRWSEIRLAFIDGGKYSFDPMMNVEIWLSPSEVAAIEMIGWEHRIGLAARNADES